MDIIEILTITLIVLASVLCIALIYFHYQISKSVHHIIVNMQELTSSTKPLLQSTHRLLNKLNYMTPGIESKLQISKSIVINIRKYVDKILNVETRIRDGFENTVMPIIKNIHAVAVGVGSFWKSYKHK